MADFPVTRIGTILAVASVPVSVAFYTQHLGFSVDALYEDPGYAILVRDGVRLSLAEQGHPAPDRPGISLHAPTDRTDLQVNLVLEVPDAELEAVRAALPQLMTSVAKLDVPLVVDVGVGPNWERAH